LTCAATVAAASAAATAVTAGVAAAGDPEPVWADESGAYLTHAFCRVTEERQSVPADAADSTDDDNTDSSSSSSSAVSDQQQQDQEQGATGEMLDLLVRSTLRSASISSLIGGVSPAAAAAAAAADSPSSSPEAAAAAAAGSSDAAQDDELEAIAYNTNGSVVFNGGSYSLGPELIEVPEPDEEAVAEYYAALEDASAAGADADVAAGTSGGEEEPQDPLSCLPFSTVLIEQALVAAGDKRVRLVATLKVRRPPGQELDIEVSLDCCCGALCCHGYRARAVAGSPSATAQPAAGAAIAVPCLSPHVSGECVAWGVKECLLAVHSRLVACCIKPYTCCGHASTHTLPQHCAPRLQCPRQCCLRTCVALVPQVARLLLYKEYWYGTADSTSSNGSSKRLSLLPSHSFEVPVTQLSRPQPTDLSGTWNVFVLAANLAVEENPHTLQVRAVDTMQCLLRW
jgi:hypothetical protein